MRRYIAIALLLAACNKTSSPSTPAFSVSASINGTPTTFNAIITVDTVSTPGTVYIIAHADSSNLTPLFEITLGSMSLKPGAYSYFDSTGLPPNAGSPLPDAPFGLVGYTNWSGDSALQYSTLSDTITLTTVSKTWISGTFQGTCEYTNDSVFSIVSVTNGQFTVGY